MHRLLLVDDEPNVLNALRRALRAGFEPGTLHTEALISPTQALERASQTKFDLVVSDFRMPEMDGVQFLQRFKKIQPLALRIMLSASAEVQTVMRAVNDGEVLRFVVKPWLDEDLITQVRQALQRADELRDEHELADAMRQQRGELSASEVERRRLESLDPGLMHVEWGPNGEVLMPDLLDPDAFTRRR